MKQSIFFRVIVAIAMTFMANFLSIAREQINPISDSDVFRNAYDFSVNNIFYKILSSTDKTVEVSVEKEANIDGTWIKFPAHEYGGNIEIPNQVSNSGITYTVVAIGEYAFSEYLVGGNDSNPLTSIKIPDSVITIGSYAFKDCSSLLNIKIPNSVKTVGSSAFSKCIGLSSIEIPSSVISINSNAFYGCSEIKGELIIPENVSNIGYNAFYGCTGITSVNYKASCCNYFDNSGSNWGIFDGCTSLTKLTIAENVECLPQFFDSTVAGKPSNITTINFNATNCVENRSTSHIEFPNLKTINFGVDVTNIPDYCFNGSEFLTGKLEIPDKVTNIGKNAFEDCVRLESVEIPPSVKHIDYGAFLDCNFSEVVCHWVTPIDDFPFSNCCHYAKLKVPKGSKSAYEEHYYTWNQFYLIEEFYSNKKQTDVLNTSIMLNKTSLDIGLDQVYKLIPTLIPSNSTDKNLEWVSSNNSIVKVSPTGYIRGEKIGKATITVKTLDGSGLSASCVVSVVDKVVEDDILVKQISLDKTSANINVGNSITLYVSLTPLNASNKVVSWKSLNNNIASVNSNGVVTALSKGTTTITATTTDGSNLSATCIVTVSDPADDRILATDIILNKSSVDIEVGSTYQLTATIKPNNATNKTIKWSSSNTSVATVSDSGLVKAVKVGSATITATTTDGSNLSTTCILTVTDSADDGILATSITLNKSSIDIEQGTTYQLNATIKPYNATNKTIKWSSSNTSVATVSDSGLVKAVKVGSATITATTTDGSNLSTSCDVTIKPVLAKSIQLNESEYVAEINSKLQLTATVLPENTTNKKVTYSSSDTSIAKVTSDGLVKVYKVGEAVITAKTTDGSNLSAKCTIKVTDQKILVTSLTLNKSSVDIEVGSSYQLTATIKPDNATNKTIKWSSSNTSVATVSDSGLVKAIKKGSATITATTSDGSNLSAKCTIKVTEQEILVTGLTLNKSSVDIEVGSSYQLTATIKPDNATNKTIKWSSSNTSVATVSDSGLVKAIKKGSVAITATTTDGSNLSVKCTITITETEEEEILVTGLTLNKSSVDIEEGSICHLTATIKPDNATNKTIKWSSSNTSVATVSYGIVEAKKKGSVTITATTTDGSNISSSCHVVVTETEKITTFEINGLWYNKIASEEVEVILYNEKYFNDIYIEIKIPEIVQYKGINYTVTSIRKNAFKNCNSLKSIEIPNSVTSIGDRAFNDCDTLTKITCLATNPPTISAYTFSNYSADLYVPIGCKAAYESAEYWKKFKNIIEVTLDNPITLNDNDATVATIGDNIVVKNARLGGAVNVYDSNGAMVKSVTATDGSVVIEAPIKGIYVVAIDGKSFKVMVK